MSIDKGSVQVLPSLPDSPRLRSTDNGAILHSGGTISGRRPGSLLQENSRLPHGLGHQNAYRSRSAGAPGDSMETRPRERDPLHRSHTNLDLKHNDSSLNKRFGSEPDLRVEEEQQKQRSNNKHFRKKYRAPPPPVNDRREGSSPDSSTGKPRPEPQRKLRLFKTRNETKKTNGHDSKLPIHRNTYTDFKSLDFIDQSFERRYKSPCKDRDPHLKYPDVDMVQSSVSLKREERLLQSKQDARKTRTDVVSGCRAKTAKTDLNEAWKTPLLNRNFRHSERFSKDDGDLCTLRREKTFDNSFIETHKEHLPPSDGIKRNHKTSGVQRNNKTIPLTDNKPLRKSLPSLLSRNEEEDEFQSELKKATSRVRSELGSKTNENKASQLSRYSAEKPNPNKSTAQSKIKESSLKKNNKDESRTNRRPVTRSHEIKSKITQPNKNVMKNETNKYKTHAKENNRVMPDRGQASGKESTPEHSPTRIRELKENNNLQLQSTTAPSKQFYFGMIETEQSKPGDYLKDFPGLGSPIIEELGDFHAIEQKLLNYRDEQEEMEKFNEMFKEDCRRCQAVTECPVSSGSSASERPGITLWLRPTMPKKPPVLNFSPNTAWRQLPVFTNLMSASSDTSVSSESSLTERTTGAALRLWPSLTDTKPTSPQFNPAAAWDQLPSFESRHTSGTRPLAVETKIQGDVTADSSPRSDPSADKSGDSGISGDHGHSDHGVDTPSRNHPLETTATWTPQQDLGDSSSEGAGGAGGVPLLTGLPTYSPGAQPFSLSLPRDHHDKGKQLQGFNSLQKLKKSVSGALGALGSRRFDLEHQPMPEEPEQNWFLTKSAPNSLSNPLLYQASRTMGFGEDIKEDTELTIKDPGVGSWRADSSYVSWSGHLMYLPPATPAGRNPGTAPPQPLSMLGPLDRPVRSKSSGCLEAQARAAREARAALAGEMRERERSASPGAVRALPAAVRPVTNRNKTSSGGRAKRFTFQSTVRQLERRRLAEKLSREADLKEQQRKTELEAMRRVEEEFQRKRAREKANIRQQLRLVSSGASSLPTGNAKARDEPDGSSRDSPGAERSNERRHTKSSSETSSRSKSTTPIRGVETPEWRSGNSARVYRDWAAAPAHAYPPACATITRAHAVEAEAFSGSPRSDNYRLEFARGRSPRTPRAPRLLPTPGSPSSSGSELSLRAVRVRW
ncbi:uncharacterized protein [Battus philenor]|uniref:uncharacterized protein n=1 Tax=Battus philenor TaxID=42288 RepID=UPI0035CEE51D